MSEHKSQQFYNHTYYAATYKEVYSWLEAWLTETIFRGDASRVFMASDGYAFRRRFELTDISRDFNSLPVAGLDLPFANYWPQNTGWKPDERVAAKNAVMIYDGVYEGTTKVKAAPVILSLPVTFYFGREDDARLAYDTLYLKTYNEHYYSTTVQYGHEKIQLPIGMTLKNLSFNPKTTEATWLTENRIFIVTATFDMRTYVLKTPKQSPWKRGGQIDEDYDPGYDKYSIVEEVLLNMDTDFYTATQYRFILKDAIISDANYTLVEYETLESGRTAFYLEGEEIPENSWRDQNFKKFFAQKNGNGIYSGFPAEGNKGTIYVDAAAPNRPTKWRWTDNGYVKVSNTEVLIDSFSVVPETTMELPWNISVATPDNELGETSFKVIATITRESEDETSKDGKYLYKTGIRNVELKVNDALVPMIEDKTDPDAITEAAIIGETKGQKDVVYISEFEEPKVWDGQFKTLEVADTFSSIKEGEDGSIIPDPSTLENTELDQIYLFQQGDENYYFVYYDEFGFASTIEKEEGQSIVEALRSDSYEGERQILDFKIVENVNELPNSSNNEAGGEDLNAATACALYQVHYDIPDTYYVFGKGERIYDFTISSQMEGNSIPSTAEAVKDLLYTQVDEDGQTIAYWWCDEVEETLKWIKLYDAPSEDGEAYQRGFKKLAQKPYTELAPASVYNYIMVITFFKEKIDIKTGEVVEEIPVEEATKTIVNSIRTKGTITKPDSSNDIENDPTPAVQHRDKLLEDDRVKNNKRLHPTENEQGWRAITGIEW